MGKSAYSGKRACGSKRAYGGKRAYRHSAYWYAYNCGYTHSDATSYTEEYLDMHTYRPRRGGGERPDGEWSGKDWFAARNAPRELDSDFNPLILGVAICMDIGVAMREAVRKVADPAERARTAAELRRDLRILRRPLYYARETERRRALALVRRKVPRRSTTAPMPTPEEVLAAWNARKKSKEAMIRLGGMLHDLACYVDSRLRFDEDGAVVGRNGGIRGWLKANLPGLVPRYKTLMRYKAMAVKLRQATGTKDPTPTERLLDEPRCELVEGLLKDFRMTFSSLEAGVSRLVDPEAVLADEEGGVGGKRRGKMTAAGGKGGCKRRGKTVSARGKGGGKTSGKTAAVSDEGGKMSGRKAVGSKGGRGRGVARGGRTRARD